MLVLLMLVNLAHTRVRIVLALENKGDINGDGVVNYIMIDG
ncbi:MAG: hypothetical protein ACOX1L_09240 [Erysipelotrichaceae bacterium]